MTAVKLSVRLAGLSALLPRRPSLSLYPNAMPEASPGISLAARVALVSYTIIVTLAIGLIVTRDPHSSTVLGFVHSAVISSPPRWVGANESTAQRVGVTARHHQSLRGAPQALTQQALPRTSSQQQDSAQASKRGVLIVSAGEQLLSAYGAWPNAR